MAGLREATRSPLVRRLAATFVISVAGLAGISQHESGNQKHNRVYLDPVGIPTVCDGHTETVTKADVGKVFSDAVCRRLLKKDTRNAEAAVQRLTKVPITQNQYDALVDFVFNVGEGNYASSTLLRKLNAGDCHGAAAQFPRWNQARGRVLPGLVTRRADERQLFEPDCP